MFKDIKVAILIIFLSVLGISGSMIALYITSTPLNVGSYTGIIMIIGIIGENAIFTFLQFHQTLETSTTDAAIIYAISTRLRPKLMTALGAIIALSPIALGIGTGKNRSTDRQTDVDRRPIVVAGTPAIAGIALRAPQLDHAGRGEPVGALAGGEDGLVACCPLGSSSLVDDATFGIAEAVGQWPTIERDLPTPNLDRRGLRSLSRRSCHDRGRDGREGNRHDTDEAPNTCEQQNTRLAEE